MVVFAFPQFLMLDTKNVFWDALGMQPWVWVRFWNDGRCARRIFGQSLSHQRQVLWHCCHTGAQWSDDMD